MILLFKRMLGLDKGTFGSKIEVSEVPAFHGEGVRRCYWFGQRMK